MSSFSKFLFILYYPMKFERKIFKGPPGPPCFEKSGPPLLKKKLDPLPWAFGARTRMIPGILSMKVVFFTFLQPFVFSNSKSIVWC